MPSSPRRRSRPTPRPRIRLAHGLGLALALVACDPPPVLPSPVIVITIDTLRADRLGCYGYGRDTSPNLDRFAQEAVLFERAETAIATTLPAHVSLWTSRYPLQTGVVANDKLFNAGSQDDRFFAESMRSAGYRTAAFVSATPVKRESGIAVGFQAFDQPTEPERGAAETTERVLGWLDEAGDKPFFLWIHYFDPHQPYEPPTPYDVAFRTDDVLLEFMRKRHFPGADNLLVQLQNNQYDGEILYVDAEIQRLLEGLKGRGLYDAATIVVTSDHGEGLGQHNHIGHGKIYNEQTHIPLIVKFPASSGLNGQRRENLVSIVDIVPTLVATLGLPVDVSGSAGVDALAGGRDYLFAQRSFAPNEKRWGKGESFSLKTEEWKLHHATENEDELYSMHRDPFEFNNRLPDQREVGRALLDRLLGLIAGYSKEGHGLELLEDQSPEILKELEKLGYVH